HEQSDCDEARKHAPRLANDPAGLQQNRRRSILVEGREGPRAVGGPEERNARGKATEDFVQHSRAERPLVAVHRGGDAGGRQTEVRSFPSQPCSSRGVSGDILKAERGVASCGGRTACPGSPRKSPPTPSAPPPPPSPPGPPPTP